MKYAFRINVADDVDVKYVNTAVKACKDFLELFPEHKDKFEIIVAGKGQYTNTTTGETKAFDGTISKEEYEQTFPNGNNEFVPLPNGRYLIPRQSMTWYENTCKSENNGLNYDKASPHQRIFVTSSTQFDDPVRYFHLGVTNKKLFDNNGQFGWGISTQETGCFVSTSNFSEEEFRRLILHEFGHIFRATSNDRSDITNTNYGEHCAIDGCILRDAVYQSLNEANKPNLFCDKCIEAMRVYIENLINNTRPHRGHSHVDDSSNNLPSNNEVNDEFKTPWRDFAQDLAQTKGWEYDENRQDVNFSVKLKALDGSYTFINASSPNNVSISAKDKDGNKCIPEIDVFKKLVAKAQNDSEKISFGNIKTPEFKARLLIACMEAEPPMKTLNAPELNDEFLSSIDGASAQRLRELRSNAETQDGFYAQRSGLQKKARDLINKIDPNVSGGEEKTPNKGSHQTPCRIPQRFRGDSR